MACGDAYKSQFVTTGGLTLEDPTSLVPLFSDFEQWKELARVWAIEATARFNVLGEIEQAHVGSFPKYNELQPLQNRMVGRYDALPDFFSGNTTVDIGKAQQVLFDAACLLEQADAAIEGYGFEAPHTPGISRKRGGLPWWGWTIVAVSTVGVLLGTLLIGARELRLRAVNPRRRRRLRNAA